MKGGYQILDLTGATAGSPVEVKGIYKAAAGNNGKPVLILTNDGQRVYAEIAKDSSDYITCYISAEGKTVNITIGSDDSVTTVISDPGASITGLEQAVNELNDNKAAKSDITDLECTGTKNTTGNTIPAGKYFYLNDVLCKAKAAINNNADFTLNTNYEAVTVDEELNSSEVDLLLGTTSATTLTWAQAAVEIYNIINAANLSTNQKQNLYVTRGGEVYNISNFSASGYVFGYVSGGSTQVVVGALRCIPSSYPGKGQANIKPNGVIEYYAIDESVTDVLLQVFTRAHR